MSDWIKNIIDENNLKENLSFVSLFISVYESMTDFVVNNVYQFLCNWKIENGEEVYTETDEYRNKIKNRIVDDKGNKDKTKASFLWIFDRSTFSEDDYKTFLSAKAIRNKYAHELFNTVLTGVAEDDANVFVKMVSLYRKITNWWIIHIEEPELGEEIPTDADLDQAQSMSNIVFDMIIDVLYNGKSDEYKKLYNKYSNGAE